MQKQIQTLDLAIQDIQNAQQFYERQQIGLGGIFLDALFCDIESLQIYAGIHPIVFNH